MIKKPILALTKGELAYELKRLLEPPFRSDQILHWLYREGVLEFSEMTNLSKELREKLAAQFYITAPKVETFVSKDSTTKYRFQFVDGQSIESVWIPDVRRNTLCISSQVGCALKCAFCVTGAMGFARNLTPDEIVAQVRHVKIVEKKPVSNIVFMGMGEPLLNFDHVMRTIQILADDKGLGIGRRKITVSTVGIAPKMRAIVEETGVKLAISLTGATDASRNHWMPINQKYDLRTLKDTLRSIRLPPGRKFTFEIVLMKDRNDTVEEAEALTRFLQGIPALVNLIPYNENPIFPDLKRPEASRVEEFQRILMKNKIRSTVRKNRGEDIMAACGQLAGKNIGSDSTVRVP